MMDEVDGILILTLKNIGCNVGSKIGEISPLQLIQCVTKCLKLCGDVEVPEFDVKESMSARYKVASQIALALTEIGYKEEIGCQSFLYPTELDTRKILIFMVEKLPKEGDVGDQIQTLLTKIAEKDQHEQEEKEASREKYVNGVEIDGIRLPAAVDVDSLPKETLKFYASHLADLTFTKQREKYRNKGEAKPIVPVMKVEEPEDDFGDPDEPLEKLFEKPEIPSKPKIKPAIPEKPQIDNNLNPANKSNKEEEKTALQITELQENTKLKAQRVTEKEKNIEEYSDKVQQLEKKLKQLENEVQDKVKHLDRLNKTDQLLYGDEDALEKVKTAVNTQIEKLMSLSQQWEKHRKPLIDEIRQKKSPNYTQSDSSKMKEEVINLRNSLKEMGQEAKAKEILYNQLLIEYEKLPKDWSRSSYTRRIGEIIGNIKKQKKEIAKVLLDTKVIQKDINTLSGKLDRTFAVADELIFKLADKDKNVALSYKILVSVHSDFSRIIKALEEVGNLKRQQRDWEDKLELEKEKGIEDKLNRLRADMTQMQNENRILEAKLRDPTINKKTANS